jgi:type I restriction enzyme R subunit
MRQALPNAAMIGFTGTPILAKHKKRTADGFVKDAATLDDLFLVMFQDFTPEELSIIKARYRTDDDVLEPPLPVRRPASKRSDSSTGP